MNYGRLRDLFVLIRIRVLGAAVGRVEAFDRRAKDVDLPVFIFGFSLFVECFHWFVALVVMLVRFRGAVMCFRYVVQFLRGDVFRLLLISASLGGSDGIPYIDGVLHFEVLRDLLGGLFDLLGVEFCIVDRALYFFRVLRLDR